MVTHESEEYVTAEEASVIIGVSRRTFERYVKEQHVKRYRRGLKQILYKRSDIESLMIVRPEETGDVRPEEQ